MRDKHHLPELLAPAGNLEKLKTAILYGADAVYVGGKQFSLRSRATNFKTRELAAAVRYCHGNGVKLYVTVNIFAHNSDLNEIEDYLTELAALHVDAVIIADPGVLAIARRVIPLIPIHLSTQANVTNTASAVFWQTQGVSRINLARELGYHAIREINAHTTIELEIFVHGALCISYSGRCMLSSYLTGRDANKGDCAHPCRYSYRLVEEKRPEEFFPVVEDDRGTYIFNSRDLCLLRQLPRLIAAGASSLKIEGRMKSVGYVGAAVRLYRTALDWIAKQRVEQVSLEEMVLPEVFTREMKKIGTRSFTENFFDSPPSSEDMLYDTMRVDQDYAPVGIIIETNPLVIEARNVMHCGDVIEYLSPGTIEPVLLKVVEMINRQKERCTRVNPGDRVRLFTEPDMLSAVPRSILRKNVRKK
ncbi:MAG: peptidase U32 [Desulfobulbus propionicus]|nr:MAG: peptidase U32 [Desulfobulbus propionicus]